MTDVKEEVCVTYGGNVKTQSAEANKWPFTFHSNLQILDKDEGNCQ